MTHVRLDLTHMAHGGEALGRHQGKVIFVPYALPGERVVVEIVQDKPAYARANLVQVIAPSPRRVRPRCRHFGDCGGCQWQHIHYEAQLQFKGTILTGQLQRVGQFARPPVRPIIESASPWGYRNVAHLVAGEAGLGYQAAGSHRVVPVAECPILLPALEKLLADFELDFPDLAEVTLRAGAHTGDLLVALRVRGRLLPALEIDQPISCVLVARGAPPIVVCGHETLEEEVKGRRYRISPESFFQVNTEQATILADLVTEALSLTDEDVVADLYCGVGLFTCLLAPLTERVIGIEISEGAVEDARHNALDLPNVTIQQGRVEDVLPTIDEVLDAMVLDPPRGGCSPQALEAVTRHRPDRIAYVSCDPATLARDLRILVDAGYALRWVQPVDMFPQSYHVESVSLLERWAVKRSGPIGAPDKATARIAPNTSKKEKNTWNSTSPKSRK